MINRIKQVIAEDKYSRRNIREKALEAINAGKKGQLKPIYEKYCDDLDQWTMEPSDYESKDARKMQIAAKGIDVVVTELFLAVLSFEGQTPIQAVAAKIEPHLGFEDVFIGIKAAAEVIGACWDTQLYKVYNEPLRIESQLRLPADVREFIENTQYMNPMLCEPDDWTNNHNGGYLTICEHVILGRHNNHMEKQALDALNIIQSIEWELDMEAVNYVEKPKHELDTPEKAEAWQHHIDKSTDVYQEMVDEGNSFWFPWKYDFRGRLYSQGYYINLQASEYKKSLLHFKQQELIQ